MRDTKLNQAQIEHVKSLIRSFQNAKHKIPPHEALVAWNPVSSDLPAVAVGPLRREGQPDWSFTYQCTGGAAYVGWRKHSDPEKACLWLFSELTAGYKIAPAVVEEAFGVIKGWPFSQARAIGIGL